MGRLLGLLFIIALVAAVCWLASGAYNLYATGKFSKRKQRKAEAKRLAEENEQMRTTLLHISEGSDTLPILSASDVLDRINKSP